MFGTQNPEATRDLDSISSTRKRLWILWAALSLAPIVFLCIVFGILQSRGLMETGLVRHTPGERNSMAFGITAIFLVGMSFFIPALIRPLILKNAPAFVDPAEEGKGNLRREVLRLLLTFQNGSIAGWAVAESAGLFAATAILLYGARTLVLVAVALFIVSLLLTAPTSARVSAFVQDQLMNRGIPLHELERELASL